METVENGKFGDTASVVDLLVTRAHELATADPKGAASYARNAAFLAGRAARLHPAAALEMTKKRAEALRELADTVARSGRFAVAERLVVRAKRLLATPGLHDVARERARADMTLGWILCARSRADEAFAALRSAGDALLNECADRLGWAKARATEGAMLFHMGRHSEAFDVLDATLSFEGIADLLDERTMAAVTFNMAAAAVETGHERAEMLCAEALERMKSAGMDNELRRCQALGAKLLGKRGKPAEALAEYERIRRELLAANQEVWAADVGASIAEIHEQEGRRREAAEIAREVLPILERAGFDLQASAVRALLARCDSTESLNA
jgi:tetratricopeptide (TPR) repeat protein